MHIVVLARTESTADGVFGTWSSPGIPALHTCEEEDRNNERSVSCIPAGTYPLRRTIYHKHGIPTFEVCGVPGRDRILIHPGNTEEDTQGCILLGLRRDKLWVTDEDSGQRVQKHAVLGSKQAFALWMESMDGITESTLMVGHLNR